MLGRIRLRSPLDPVALAHRLKDAVGTSLTPSTPDGVTGHGTEQAMVLRYHRRGRQGGFAPVFSARMTPDRGGTLIVGRYGLSRFNWLFCTLWFAFLSLFAAGGVALIHFTGEWFIGGGFILIPALMMGMVIVAIAGDMRDRRKDKAVILAFLEKVARTTPAN